MSEAAAEQQPGAYQVLARKYRPQNFDDLIGHGPMVRTLRNAFATGRIAHAYVLTGVRGVGKTTTARILARALNYVGPDGADPDGADNGPTIDMTEPGLHCQAIAESRHPDVLEMDAASRTGVGDIRELIEGVRYAPVEARYKVYIIDEVHMLSTAAFNALLKTLEEPPPHVKFIFATTEIRKLPVTVLSRCQRFDLRRVDPETLTDHLIGIAGKEGFEIERDGVWLIAKAAEGSVRDGLSILDQAIVQHSEDGPVKAETVRDMLGLADRGLVWDLTAAIFKGEAKAALSLFRQQYDAGADPTEILRDLLEIVHLLTRVKVAGPDAAAHGPSGEADAGRARDLGDALQMNVLTRAWTLLLGGLDDVRRAPDGASAAEMVLIKIAFAADLPTLDEALKSLKGMQAGNGQSAAAQNGSSPDGRGQLEQGKKSADTDAVGQASEKYDALIDGPAVDGLNSEMSGDMATISGGATSSGGRHGNAAPAMSVVAGRTEPQPAPRPQSRRRVAPDAPRLNSFQDIVRLVAAKKDAKLRVELESYVHLIKFEPGRLTVRFHKDAPADLSGRLVQRLRDWTGEVWTVTVDSNETGAPTLRDHRYAQTMADPIMVEALKYFPNAEILSIRERHRDALPNVLPSSEDPMDAFSPDDFDERPDEEVD
ncbi:MAG: DNA polymerase III subunit gamma/tau [Pseudomonadota bacterium]